MKLHGLCILKILNQGNKWIWWQQFEVCSPAFTPGSLLASQPQLREQFFSCVVSGPFFPLTNTSHYEELAFFSVQPGSLKGWRNLFIQA